MRNSFQSMRQRSRITPLVTNLDRQIASPLWKAQCDDLVQTIEEKKLSIAGMITVHPYRTCSYKDIQELSKAIDFAVQDTFDPQGRQKGYMLAPVLTSFEGNHEDSSQPDGYHFHKIYCYLPVDRVLDKNVLTYGTAQCVQRVCKKDRIYGHQRINPNHLSDPRLHLLMYKDAMLHPPRLDRHECTIYRLLSLIPNGVKGHYITPVDESRSYMGYFGWKGLIAYVTKQCAYGDPSSVIDLDQQHRLKSYVPKCLNSLEYETTLERFF
jgi:hypothetical protein